VVQSAFSNGRLIGVSVAVLSNDEVVFVDGFGKPAYEAHTPTSHDTSYCINEVTTGLTAVAVLMLVDKGTLHLEDHLSLFFPEYTRPRYDPTIRQLLQNTAGLRKYGGPAVAMSGQRKFSAKEWVDLMNGSQLYWFAPGTGWNFSDVGYDILGLIIAKVSGQSYEEFVRSGVLDPAGMRYTHLCAASSRDDGRAVGFKLTQQGLVNAELWGTYGEASRRWCSCVQDLAAFHTALERGGILSAASLHTMREPGELHDHTLFDYGLGARLGLLGEHRLVAWTGSGDGNIAALVSALGTPWTVIVLANVQIGDAGLYNVERIATDMLRGLIGMPPFETKDLPVPSELAGRLHGQWEDFEGPTNETVVTDGRLHVGPVGVPLEQLFFQGGTTFCFEDDGPYRGLEIVFDPDRMQSVRAYKYGIFDWLSLKAHAREH
jgi:CubicO group peptidase (beta-lactamase class C family)